MLMTFNGKARMVGLICKSEDLPVF